MFMKNLSTNEKKIIHSHTKSLLYLTESGAQIFSYGVNENIREPMSLEQ